MNINYGIHSITCFDKDTGKPYMSADLRGMYYSELGEITFTIGPDYSNTFISLRRIRKQRKEIKKDRIRKVVVNKIFGESRHEKIS